MLFTHLGGNGNMKEMMENLMKIFEWDDEKSTFLKDVSITAHYNRETFEPESITLCGGWADKMYINDKGITWDPYVHSGCQSKMAIVVNAEKLKKFN